MKAEEHNASAERIVLLLILLTGSQEGVSREEIFEHIPAYRRDGKEGAQQKMLDRDFSTLEKCGIRLVREKYHFIVRYRVIFP